MKFLERIVSQTKQEQLGSYVIWPYKGDNFVHPLRRLQYTNTKDNVAASKPTSDWLFSAVTPSYSAFACNRIAVVV